MEKQIKNIFYITTGFSPEKAKKRKKKDVLPIYKCNRSYPYAEGKPSAAGNPVATGLLQIYFSTLPEDMTTVPGKRSKRKKWLGMIEKVMDYAENMLECKDTDNILFSENLCRILGRDQTVPPELYGIFLWTGKREKNYGNITLALPEECGPLMTESVIALLEPYLARINVITFAGKETEQTRVLEDYFYNEYGIVADYGKHENEDSAMLNFSDGSEILKFLDTAVKSGYNTKVN